MQGTSFFSDIVGIGAAPSTGNSLNVASNIVGTFGTGIFQQGQVQSNVTGSSFGFLNTLNIVNTAFTTNSVAFAASQGTIGGSVTLSANTGFLAASSLTTGTNVYGFRGQIASGTGRFNLFMDGTANNFMAGRLALGSISAIATRGVSNRLQLTGGSIAVGYELESEIASSVTGEVRGYQTYITQQIGGSLNRLVHYWVSSQSTFGGSVTNQYGVFIEAGLIGATNNFGLYSEIPSGSNRWNLYMQGTANNYMAGNLLLKTAIDQGYTAQITGSADLMLNVWGATSPSIRLDNAASAATQRLVLGLATATNNFIQGAVAGNVCISTASVSPVLFGMWNGTNATEVMRLSTANNVSIGSSTDTGNRLYLNGSLRIDGQRSATAGGSSGQHLIITLDGIQYKIQLLNP